MNTSKPLSQAERSGFQAIQKVAQETPDFDTKVRAAGQAIAERAKQSGGSPKTTAGTPTLATISGNTYWWGFNFVVPEASMEAMSTAGDVAEKFIELLGDIEPELEPFTEAASLYMKAELSLARALDVGAGVYLSATWLTPAVFIPTPIEWELIKSSLGHELVLDVQGFQTENGTPLDAYTQKSSGTDNQLWTYVNGLYLVSKQSGRVVDIADSDPSNGAKVQIWDWNGGTNQQWKIDGDGFIRSVMNGNVLDVSQGSITPGTPVISYQQKTPPGSNQLWSTDF